MTASEASGQAPAERLFFALWPDAEVGQRLARTARDLCAPLHGRATPVGNLHITLAFLGDCTVERRACMEQAAGVLEAAPFELRLDRVQHVPRRSILWLGASELPPPLLALVRGLATALLPCGYAPERRPFQAHVTLMRKIHHPPRTPLSAELSWPVVEFALVRSELTRAGAHYTVLRRWALAPRDAQG